MSEYKMIKKFLLALSLLGLQVFAEEDDNFEIMEYEVDKSITLPTAPKAASEAWKDQRFGMFIHWGPISQMGKQLSHSRNSPSHNKSGKAYKSAPIAPEVYDVQYKTFNPVKFKAGEMMQTAKNAGIDYIVFTAKHHAGFAMFDSAVSDYDMMATPYQNDIVKQLTEACKSKDMDFGFYYSPRDWYHPDCDSDENHDRYIKFYKKQMYELMTKYGPIHEIWFDGMGPGEWGDTSTGVMNAIRKLHPNAMVNDRGGAGADFYTPEHCVSYFNREYNWEACHTTTGQWGFNPDVKAKSFDQLMKILLYTWGADGNMLLNIGPRGDGSMNPVEQERFEQLAEWWEVHGEKSIRGTRGGPYLPGPWGVATTKANRVYLHVLNWPENGELVFPDLAGKKIQQVELMNGEKIHWQNKSKGFGLKLDPSKHGEVNTTIEVTFDSDMSEVQPLARVNSLTLNATLSASHNQQDLKNLIDQNANTNWHAKLAKGEKEFWVEASFDGPTRVSGFQIGRGDEWSPKHKFLIEAFVNGKWKNITPKGLKLKWEPVKFLAQPVTAEKFRVRVSGTKKFVFAEWELYSF